jgi:uncharacterized protein
MSRMLLQGVNFEMAKIDDFCRRWGVRRLSLFGSILTDEFGPESDVDVLVEFLPGTHVGLIGMGTMQAELIDLIGREVDLRTPNELSDLFRAKVLSGAKLLHAA